MRSEPLPVMKPLKRDLLPPGTSVSGNSFVSAVTVHSPSGSLNVVGAFSTAMLLAPSIVFGSSTLPFVSIRFTSPTIT